jgi:hypothetical protein
VRSQQKNICSDIKDNKKLLQIWEITATNENM